MNYTINGLDLLPEPLIHHIQSFLTNKEAARTAILSRFWRNAWLTRPELEFDHSDFKTPGFLDSAMAFMQRYQDSNLKIDRFTLRTSGNDMKDLFAALVGKAVALGSTHFDLSFDSPFVLPEELLGLGFQALIGLSLDNCSGNDVLKGIFSSCHLIIQKLEFYSCCGSFDDELSPMNLWRFPNLNSLVLENVDIHPSLFIDFTSRFPRLKYLCIDNCRMNKRPISVHNSSTDPSPDILAVAKMVLATSEELFDCLNIANMEFRGSRQDWAEGEVGKPDWECGVRLHMEYKLSEEVAKRLGILLRELRRSRISLFISVDSSFDCDWGPFQCVDHRDIPEAVVENLSVHAPSSTLCLLLSHGLDRVLTALQTTCFVESSLRRIETSINGEIPLPEGAIQLIQSFLTPRQAAQTTLLSKSWHNAWSTRPNLEFQDFHVSLDHVTNTLQRYQDLNLKIESLSLSKMSGESHLKNELAVKALNMGATHLKLEYENPETRVVLPEEVLGSETLVELSVRSCIIGGGKGKGKRKVICSKLESLTLSNVYAAGHVIQDIFSSCLSIHTLSFYNIRSEFTRTIFTPCELHKLHRLSLEEVGVRPSFFNDFSSKFPCLKDLSVHACRGFQSLRISSSSMETASFQLDIKRAEFDFPNIRKFHFGIDREDARISPVPCISVKTLSTEWESTISMGIAKYAITSQFLKRLKVFLTKLSSSKISLYLSGCVVFGESIEFTEYFRGLPKVVVEELDLFVTPPVFLATVKGLFCICRPKSIKIMWFPNSCGVEEETKRLINFILKRLEEYESDLSDLREVHVKVRGDSLEELVPLEKFWFDVFRKVRYIKQIRSFELRWGQ